MNLHLLNFKGHFEERPEDLAEQLQLVEPENDLERELLAAAILAHDETITDDEARREYVFTYAIGNYLERGLYRLHVSGRDASKRQWHVEIAAGMVGTTAAASDGRRYGFSPFWFLSKSLHFKPSDPRVEQRYPGHAYGRLIFDTSGVLPHRRLFHA
jgi:hypothetical protein